MFYIAYTLLFIIIIIIIYRSHETSLNLYKNRHIQKTRRENFILEYLSHAKEISSEEIKNMFHVSESTAMEYLHNLEYAGLIKRGEKRGNKIIYILNKK